MVETMFVYRPFSSLLMLAFLIAVIVLFVRERSLRQRITALEAALAGLIARRAAPDEVAPQGAAQDGAAAPVPGPGDVAAGVEAPAVAASPWPSAAEPAVPPPLPPNLPPPVPPAVPPGAAFVDAAARPAPLAARLAGLGHWLRTNWIYAISALSLALAGVFFVQYGIENGLLPPAARVAAAILFGLALIAGGEWLRRRSGDDAASTTAYLPSTFAGAGLVAIFAGIVAARQLYGLTGPGVTFAGLAMTAAAGIALGWFYGPLLAAVGLIGAAAAPFLVGGASDDAAWLYGYFGLIGAVGLAIDTMRRWAWVSVLALVLAYLGSFVIAWSGAARPDLLAILLLVLPCLAILIPARSLRPDQSGAMLSARFRAGSKERPAFPTCVAGGALLASSLGLAMLATTSPAGSMLAFVCLTILAILVIYWSSSAPALADLSVLPAAALLGRLVIESFWYRPLYGAFRSQEIAFRPPETGAPLTVSLLLGLAVVVSAAAFLAGDRAGRLRAWWAAGAAVMAPAAAASLELAWSPADVVGAYGWALQIIALAALMVALAVHYARADGEDRRRAAYATLSALSLIALSFFLILTTGALTLALAVLVVVAAGLDRRFGLPEMSYFIMAAVVALSYRLIADPGLFWATNLWGDGRPALWEIIASYFGSAAAMVAANRMLADLPRLKARVFLESGISAAAALGLNVLLVRWLSESTDGDWLISYWGISLTALPWLIIALTQLHRQSLGGILTVVRWIIVAVAGMIAALGFALVLGPFSPLVDLMGLRERLVYGPPVLDTLLIAYGLPGLCLAFAARTYTHLARGLRLLLGAMAAAFGALYVGLEIRRFWRGDDLVLPGMGQGELYSYTVALMVVGAVLLYQAIAAGSRELRRLAMTIIGLTIAKVFLIDASGLTGLTRVMSFVGLGLALAALAWLNRWAAARNARGQGGA